jgi:hypothetical protein
MEVVTWRRKVAGRKCVFSSCWRWSSLFGGGDGWCQWRTVLLLLLLVVVIGQWWEYADGGAVVGHSRIVLVVSIYQKEKIK